MQIPLDRFRAATAAEVREMDRRAIQEFGVPGTVLMENAGVAASEVALRFLARCSATTPVVIVCGKGNNGGDGYVVARHLHNQGFPALVFMTHDPAETLGDARTHLEILMKMRGITAKRLAEPGVLAEFAAALAETPLVVDALFGTGLSSVVRPPHADYIHAINRASRPVLSVDIPSGLHADTGEVLGACVRATTTVTFALPKKGLLVGLGPEMAGEVILVDIGIPADIYEGFHRNRCVTE